MPRASVSTLAGVGEGLVGPGGGGDRYEAERDQWEDGNNVLALAPGVVVAYERNVETNTRLRYDGIQVITIEGSELGRCLAGPRRLACPIERDALPNYA